MALSERPAERHREIAGAFTDRVRGARSWDVPSPVPAWPARGGARRGGGCSPPFRRDGSGVALPGGPSVDDDPVGAWQSQSDAVQALLDDPATAARRLTNPHIGELPLDGAIDQFY